MCVLKKRFEERNWRGQARGSGEGLVKDERRINGQGWTSRGILRLQNAHTTAEQGREQDARRTLLLVTSKAAEAQGREIGIPASPVGGRLGNSRLAGSGATTRAGPHQPRADCAPFGRRNASIGRGEAFRAAQPGRGAPSQSGGRGPRWCAVCVCVRARAIPPPCFSKHQTCRRLGWQRGTTDDAALQNVED